MASSSSLLSGSWKYDVFLSFRGEDTRKTFVDHLYFALEQHRILLYKDDVTLARGDTIGPSLIRAIESSKILVIIFSENYADSSWCLDELSHIMKCKDSEKGQIVMPIFYHVDPSHVRKQKGKYREAFSKHELSEDNKKKLGSWKKALVDASNIAGWEPKHVANGHEAKCIQEIVDSILGKLVSLYPVVEDEELVGMGSRIKTLKSQLRIGLGGVRMVGIWGIGGGGKTTLATSLYMELKNTGHFGGCCFLDNIREKSKQQNGLTNLQKKILSAVFCENVQVESVDIGKHTIKNMLCRRNVLVVLDDVDHLDQLKALAGFHEWFGDGSRIIITTRDQHLLIAHKVDEICPVSLLSQDEAIRLFRRHAYYENNPLEDYEKLSFLVISYVNGLPLALKILGSFLYDKNKDEWLSTLSRLKDHPEMDIVEKLKISYDGLKTVEKELFLDIACFFRGRLDKVAMEILDDFGFHPCIGVKVLTQKALITVSENGEFDMHDLVQEMGHYIVRGDHPNNPEQHSRVWRKEDIEDICSRSATTENDKIEGIRYDGYFTPSNFIMLTSKMKKLRFLEVINNTSFDERPGFLSEETKCLSWKGYSSSVFPESFQPTKLFVFRMPNVLCKGYKTSLFHERFSSRKLDVLKMGYPGSLFPESFQLRKLVGLQMEFSLQKELWMGYKYLPCLKEMELSFMKVLERTPDFGGLPCLQKLILRECERLEEIHQSLGNHKSLVYVHIKSCKKLAKFPSIIRMDKLEILEISYCPAFIEFPKIEAKMDSLIELFLYRVGIEVLPSSVGEYCTNLISLRLKWCRQLKSIEGNFHALKCLKKFALEAVIYQFMKLPKDLLNENLDMLRIKLPRLGTTVQQLILPRCLRKLDLCGCELKDGEIPNEVGQLSSLQELDVSYNSFKRLDFSLSRLTSLKLLLLSHCWYLVELPQLPSSLAILRADYCLSLNAIIRDDIHKNCKRLCDVSIQAGGENNIIGGERLIKTMFQGNSIGSRCISLHLDGFQTLRVFKPGVVRGGRCRMQLPKNWYNDFSGFLFFTASIEYVSPYISIKHEGDSTEMKYLEWRWNDYPRKSTWVGYIPFVSLRNTLWWRDHQTSTSIQIQFDAPNVIIRGCGCKLIPNRSETAIIKDSSFDDVYTCRLNIERDSKSAFKCSIRNINCGSN